MFTRQEVCLRERRIEGEVSVSVVRSIRQVWVGGLGQDGDAGGGPVGRQSGKEIA
jgi:hypothetical protein